MTVRVIHPHLPGVARTVPDADVERWVAQGWLPPVEDSAPAVTQPARRRSRKSTTTDEGSES